MRTDDDVPTVAVAEILPTAASARWRTLRKQCGDGLPSFCAAEIGARSFRCWRITRSTRRGPITPPTTTLPWRKISGLFEGSGSGSRRWHRLLDSRGDKAHQTSTTAIGLG